MIQMGNVPGDLYYIEKSLKELDPDIELGFNYSTEEYVVNHKDYHVMNWPRPLDQRLVTHMRKIDMRRGYDPLKEIDEHNEMIDKAIEKDRLNHLEAVVKDNRRRLANEIDGINMKTVF